MKTKLKTLGLLTIAGLLVSLTTACGSGDGAPTSATVTVTPTAYDIGVPAGAAGGLMSDPLNFTVSVTSGTISPTNRIPIWVYAAAGSELRIRGDTNVYALDRQGTPIMLETQGAIDVMVSVPLIPDSDYGDNIQFSTGAHRVLVELAISCFDSGGNTCP